jgi:TonB family protein
VERSAGLHHLGLALLRRGLDQRWHATRSEPADGTESLTLAADAFRRATAEAGGRRPSSLLALADTLVWLGQLDEARQVLEEYGAAGGRDRQAEDLRCWIAGAPYGQPAAADGSRADDGDLQPPIKRYAPAPQHTKAARVAGEAGLVILQAILDEEGTVRCVRVLRTDGLSREMIENTLATVKRWRFDPARRNGEAVGVYYTLTVRFG